MINRNSVFFNMIWRFLERISAQLVTFIVSIVLARLLEPSAYGIIALVSVIIAILQVFVDGGFAIALIQKKDADDLDFSTVFYFNISMCVFFYILVFGFAPYISHFYKIPDLTNIIRTLGLVIIISGIKNIQQAYVARNMLFKRFFFATLGGTLGAAGLGIILAYLGFGVWALVLQMLFNTTVDTLILWITVKWRPLKAFSLKRLKILFSFGWKMLLANLVATINQQIRQLIIGKKYSSEALAFYNRGQQFPNLIVTNVNTSIDSVLLPALSNKQDDISCVREMTRKSIKVSTYIMAPLLVGLWVCADNFVSLILTDKWLPCVPFLRIFCIAFFFYPIHTANLNAIKAMGRSDILLKMELIKDIVSVLILLITMKFGTLVIAYGMLISSLFAQIINAWPNRKILEYSYKQQLLDIFPNGLIAVMMGMVVYCIQFCKLHNGITLLIQIVMGAVLYLFFSLITKNESFIYLLDIIKIDKLRKE